MGIVLLVPIRELLDSLAQREPEVFGGGFVVTRGALECGLVAVCGILDLATA